jgi:hypothetical protein
MLFQAIYLFIPRFVAASAVNRDHRPSRHACHLGSNTLNIPTMDRPTADNDSAILLWRGALSIPGVVIFIRSSAGTNTQRLNRQRHPFLRWIVSPDFSFAAPVLYLNDQNVSEECFWDRVGGTVMYLNFGPS